MLLVTVHLVTWYIMGIHAVGSIGIEAFFSGLSRGVINAGFIFWILVFIGIAIASASWLFLLLLAILTVITHLMILVEERTCLNKFGNAYCEYMNRTARWIGIPKS